MEGGRCPRPGPLDGSPAPGSSSSRPRLGDHGSSFGRTPGAAQPAPLPGSAARPARSPGETFPGSSEEKLPPRTLRTERQPPATRMEREGKGWLAASRAESTRGGEKPRARLAARERGAVVSRGLGRGGRGGGGTACRKWPPRARGPRPLPCSRACAGKSSQGSFGAGRLRGVFASPCS